MDSELVEGLQVQVQNAGLVILWPFLTTLFTRLEMLNETTFIDEEKEDRAAYLLQYLAYNSIDFPEHELTLNKVFVGTPLSRHLTRVDSLSDQEVEMTQELLRAVIQNWTQVGNSSPQAIQETFVQRSGILTFKKEHVLLRIEKKGVDVLLSSIPWNYTIIKLPWMSLPLHIEWTND